MTRRAIAGSLCAAEPRLREPPDNTPKWPTFHPAQEAQFSPGADTHGAHRLTAPNAFRPEGLRTRVT
jgi:hypothetical protein